MKLTVVIAGLLIASLCNAQKPVIGISRGTLSSGSGGNILVGGSYINCITTGSSSTKLGYDYPAFKEEKCIVIYLDGLEVKADSATRMYRADTTTYEYRDPNKSYDMGNGTYTTTLMAIVPVQVPKWFIYKVIRKNKKEVPLQSIIQYK